MVRGDTGYGLVSVLGGLGVSETGFGCFQVRACSALDVHSRVADYISTGRARCSSCRVVGPHVRRMTGADFLVAIIQPLGPSSSFSATALHTWQDYTTRRSQTTRSPISNAPLISPGVGGFCTHKASLSVTQSASTSGTTLPFQRSSVL
ncbi:hypothetical protein BDV96DRAFT_342004 [Lophiotrema nucula]|uniref:Uncharacterized protein n=1 Tax=Lophiotrema nucula TaxID=690887 RepID=A0A6A5ZJ19_9PLEO|nr:hypothetical protein BDV96DRAFT_342004 [Lophiotrema nucula]